MSPGPIETPALETTTGLTAEQAEQAAAQFSSQIPMGRRGKPGEIAAAVTFFASDESSFITGVDLAVDGGMAQVWPRRGRFCDQAAFRAASNRRQGRKRRESMPNLE